MATSTGQSPLSYETRAVVPNAAANADAETTVCIAPFVGTLSAASFVADTLLTGANTESRTLQLINKGQSGAGTTVMASKAFVSGTNAAAFDEVELTLSGTAADLDVAEGDVIVLKSLHVGATGLADPGGTVFVALSRA